MTHQEVLQKKTYLKICTLPSQGKNKYTYEELGRLLNVKKDDIEDECSSEAAAAFSPDWCRNCDCKHEDGATCPLLDPATVVADSVIDFSTNKDG